ncbi:MAG TPA: DUF1579 family protein [Terriglobales bacterium]
MKKAAAAIAICLCLGRVTVAQSPMAQQSPAAPTPSQQQLAMGYFGGPWKITGTTRISPATPPVQFTSTATGEWVPGNYFMEIKYVTHGPLGDIHAVRMLEYNSSDQVYTYNEYNSLGEHVLGVGKIVGQKWIWETTKKLNGVVTKGRYIATFVTQDAYSLKSEVKKPGGGWLTVTEGTATRMPGQNQ